MKILIYSGPGQAENVLPLYRALLKRGEDVTYLMSSSNLNSSFFNVNTKLPQKGVIPASSFPELRFIESFVDMGGIYVANSEFRLRTPLKSLLNMVRVLLFVRRGNFDVIHTDITYMYWENLMYFFRQKTVNLQHDPFEHSGLEMSKATKRRVNRALRLIKKFVILNKTQHLAFCNTFHIKPNQVLVNKLGPMEHFEMFKKNNVQERKNNVLFFGGILKYKGIEYLCEAMTKVHKVIPDATVTIAGSKPFYFDIEPYRKLPYFEIINRFIGVNEMTELVQKCTIGAFPYTDSTQSGCVLTCYTLGKPVVVSDIETMREIVDDGKSGLLAENRNADRLADAIIYLLQHEEERNVMRRYIENEYFKGDRSWDGIAAKYIEFYKR